MFLFFFLHLSRGRGGKTDLKSDGNVQTGTSRKLLFLPGNVCVQSVAKIFSYNFV